MTTEQESLMAQYGIRQVQETRYIFEEFKYSRLEDALSFARKQAERKSGPESKAQVQNAAGSARR